MIDKLCKLLIDIDANKKSGFSGIGIVLYQEIESLPVSPLLLSYDSITLPINEYNAIVDLLIHISSFSHKFHDGFHLLSNELHLTHLAQYFSTPIVTNAALEYEHGSRYRTAIYGSFLPNVIACGVIGADYAATVFRKGEKINPHEVLN